jgi:hypothetical protein
MTKAKPTPYLKGKNKIGLSGGDQVQIMLKSWFGSWAKYIKHEEKSLKRFPHKKAEIDQAKRLQAFEREHKIKFRYNETDKVYWIALKGSPLS